MPLTVFHHDAIIARGSEAEIAAALRALSEPAPGDGYIAFDDESGKQVDLDLAGNPVPPRRRGRPSLGVQAREVTLLPRHWEWLARQSGGASAALRRMVEEALRRGRSERECRDAAYWFLNAMAGDRQGFEEAVRAIYAGDVASYERFSTTWPAAIREHGHALAFPE